MVNVKELISKFRKKEELGEEPLKEEEIKEEPVEELKPAEPESGDTNIKMILVKLDMLSLKIDNLDKRLQNIEELAKK